MQTSEVRASSLLDERLRALIGATADIVFEMSADWSEMRVLHGNGLLFDTDTPRRSWLDDYILPEDQPQIMAAVDQAIRTKAPYRLEHRVMRSNGSVAWLLSRAAPVMDESGTVTGWLGLANDVTGQYVTNEALTRTEQRFRALFEAIDDGFCIIEFIDGPHGPLSDYVHVEANAGYERHSGIPDIVGQTVRMLAPEQADGWVELYGTVLRTGKPLHFERYFAQAGRHIEVSASRVEPASLRQVSVLFRDIDARKRAEEALHRLNDTLEHRVAERSADLMRAEEQLRQAQKMEAVGQLTGGLAHDFNNLLGGISGAFEMIARRLEQGRASDVGKYLTGGQGAVRRAAALTQRLLAFSRRQTLDPRPTDVDALVHGMVDLIRRSVGPGIVVEVEGAADLGAALVDPSLLENALLNLCLNARDAMPDGGKITIATCNQTFVGEAATHLDLEEGRYLTLSVTDTGTGMTPDVVAKAFDPFFTTKPLGEGTGLGLSMIYGFARQSGGQVRIESKPGQGSSLFIYLPRHHGTAQAGEEDEAAGEGTLNGSGQTVLVVDDEATIRLVLVDVLEEQGYRVIEAEDSVWGLAVLQSDARIDLLITDVGLPGGMNGRQMAEAGRAVRPGLKVLLITGYAQSDVFDETQSPPDMALLSKPFVVETLALRVQEVMSGQNAGQYGDVQGT